MNNSTAKDFVEKCGDNVFTGNIISYDDVAGYEFASQKALDQILPQDQSLLAFIDAMTPSEVNRLAYYLKDFAPFREIATRIVEDAFHSQINEIKKRESEGCFFDGVPTYEFLRKQAY